MSPRSPRPRVEEALSQLAERLRHLETEDKWQFGMMRNADHFAVGSLTGGITEAVTNLGGSEGVVFLPPKRYPIPVGTPAIPATVHLIASRGAILDIANGATLAINGTFEGDLSQHFNYLGTGTMTFGRASVEWVYPQWWTALGDGSFANPWTDSGVDYRTPIQFAINALPVDGGVVYLKQGHYSSAVKHPISIGYRDNVVLWAEPGAIFHHKWAATGAEAINIYGKGPAWNGNPESNLTADASPGDSSVNVVNSAGFAEDEYVLLSDDEIYDDGSGAGGCLAGEIHQIRAVVGNTIHFNEPVWDEYLQARNAKVSLLVLSKGIQIHNLWIQGYFTQPHTGIKALFTDHLVIKNVTVHDFKAGTGVFLGSCISPLVENTKYVWMYNAQFGTGLALTYATQFARVVGGSAKYVRHGIAMSGSRVGPAGRPRENLIDGFESDWSKHSAFDVHAGVDSNTWRNCVARHIGGGHGWVIRGSTAWIENPKIVDGAAPGGIIFANETDQPTNIAVIGGSIQTGGFGIKIIETSSAAGHSLGYHCQAHDCESVRIEGVDIKPGTDGIVYDSELDYVLTQRLAIIGNPIGSSGSNTGIRVQKVKCGSIADNPILGGGVNSIGIDLQEDTQHVVVSANSVHANRNVGSIGVKYAGSRNLVVGNNLYQTANALSDVGANNRSASNLDETGALS